MRIRLKSWFGARWWVKGFECQDGEELCRNKQEGAGDILMEVWFTSYYGDVVRGKTTERFWHSFP